MEADDNWCIGHNHPDSASAITHQRHKPAIPFTYDHLGFRSIEPISAWALGCRTEERRRVTRSFNRYNQRYKQMWSDRDPSSSVHTDNTNDKKHGSAARAAPRGRPGGAPPATAHPARVDATGRLCTTHRPQSLVLVVLLLLGVFPVVVAAVEWVRQRQAARRKVLHVLRDGALDAGLALYHG